MREALGSSMLFNLIMIFTAVFIALLIGSLAYSKGFKVRNRIIDIIEKYEGYEIDEAKKEIDENLRMVGYQINLNKKCDKHNNTEPLQNKSAYDYCVYKYDTSKGYYYGVKVFIHFDFPIIGGFIEIPLYGETRIIFRKSEVEN